MSNRMQEGLRAMAFLLVLGIGAACTEGADADRAGVDPAVASAPPDPVDWAILGGEVIDGTGAPARRADVLVAGARIAHVGIVDPDTLEIGEHFDATGRVVTPGFIDLHAHGDPLETPHFPNFLAQGVTTILLGQDGSGIPAVELAAHLEAVDARRPSVNVGYLVGHNTIRGEAGVGASPGTPSGYHAMATLVSTAMDAGAFGLSLGLEYSPGRFADAEELAAIAAPVAERDGVVMSHLRTEDAGRVREAVEELLEQGRRSGARVHVSHMKIVLGNDPAEAREVLALMDAARAGSMGVSGDLYPYLASFTGLSILFPDWARSSASYDEAVRRRRDELGRHLRERVMARNGPSATLFATGPWAGRTLEEAARETGLPFEEVLIDLGPDGARAAYFVMDEEVMKTFLADPMVAVASDGSPTMGHPRGYGTFPRVIRRHVLEDGLLSIEEAVRRMTSLPASIIGIDDPGPAGISRGSIRPGSAADLAVFDPREFVDRADFENPHLPAVGMAAVWVGGRLTWRDGGLAEGAGNGEVLRRNTDHASEGTPR